MFWDRLTKGLPDDFEVPVVPDDISDARRLSAHTDAQRINTEAREGLVDNLVGSLSSARRANHFSQMAIESMARIPKE